MHQGVFADDSPRRLDQCHQHVERAPAKLQQPALGQELAAVRQNTETAEFDRRWCLDGVHTGDRRLRYWEIEPLIFRGFQIFSGGWTPSRSGPLIGQIKVWFGAR